jgi:phage tail-like protein
MATAARNDLLYTAFNFNVEIDGVVVGGFSEVPDLQTEPAPIEYRTGAEDITVRKIPGLREYPNIVLKRGYTTSCELWEWRKTAINGRTDRRSGYITLLYEARQKAMEWKFWEGWPSKWDGPALNAKNNEVRIETLEIAHEGLKLA